MRESDARNKLRILEIQTQPKRPARPQEPAPPQDRRLVGACHLGMLDERHRREITAQA